MGDPKALKALHMAVKSFCDWMKGKWAHLGDFSFHQWHAEVYVSLEQQAHALDMAEGARGVPVPTAKITDQHLGPMDSVISLLSNETWTELAELRREYATTFADKLEDGGKFVFQCREDYQQGLLKEVNASSTYKFADNLKVQGTEQLAYTEAQCAHDIHRFLQGNSLYYPSSVSMDEGHPDYAPVLPHMYA